MVPLSLSPVISENDLCRLGAIQSEVVSHGPSLHVGELRMPRRLVAGRDNNVRVVGVLAHRVTRHSGDEVSGGDDICGWSYS